MSYIEKPSEVEDPKKIPHPKASVGTAPRGKLRYHQKLV